MSGPGDRAPKTSHKEGPTLSHQAEGHAATSVNVSLDRAALPGSKSSARSYLPSAREPGDLGGAAPAMVAGRQPREGNRRTPRSQTSEESDARVVPKKPGNLRVTPRDSAEGRGAANGKPASRDALRTQGRAGAPTDLERVGQRAMQEKGVRFTNLLNHVRVPLLKEAYLSLRKNAAPGVDGVTWSEYGDNLDARLLDLQDRVHRGNYRTHEGKCTSCGMPMTS